MSNAPELFRLLTSVMRVLPTRPLELILSRLMSSIVERHPLLFERLGPHASKTIAIAPVDVPLVFLLRPAPQAPSLEVRRDQPVPVCDAVVTGPFFALVDLAEGQLDGDALFFSRLIRIEGDMEAVLAWRNALDGEGLDLVGEAMAPLGALSAGPALVARRCFELLRAAIEATSAGRMAP
jgi:predicted lipid carrier protein YhbT